MTTVYRVEYYDKEEDYWFNADQSLCPEDLPSYKAAIDFAKWHRQFNYGKLRIVKREITTTIMETD